MYKKIKNGMDHFITSACILVVIGIIILVNLGIVSRYFLNDPVGWTEELSRYFQVWLTFLGVPLVFLYFAHIYINYLPEALKGKTKFILTSFIYGTVVFISVDMFLKGIVLVSINWNMQCFAMDMPLGIMLYLSLPISAVLIIIAIALNMIGLINEPDEKMYEEKEGTRFEA